MTSLFELLVYTSPDGREPFVEWMAQLKDRRIAIAVDRRLARMQCGNFGDHKALARGLWELRIPIGPGLRVYYGFAGNQIVLLLAGGDKSSQARDIDQARERLLDWQRRNNG